MSDLEFRRAVAADAEVLARLAFASKAHWGYDAAFMENVRPFLAPTAAAIGQGVYYLAELDGESAGFYGFIRLQDSVRLCDLWLLPSLIGRGLGARLWTHLVATAHSLALLPFFIESDPNAEGFYLHMGARRIGESIAEGTGRSLPFLCFEGRAADEKHARNARSLGKIRRPPGI